MATSSNDAERLELWDTRTQAHKSQCMDWLHEVLANHDVSLMGQLFSTQGFILGQKSQAVHQAIFRAYINGTTTLNHIKLFFQHLGGSFYTNQDQNICVWNEIAFIETHSPLPEDFNQFCKKLQRIESLVHCLVDEFNMPVNPDKHFAGIVPDRPLNMAREFKAWMLYHALASYYMESDPTLRLTRKDIETDPYMMPELREFWRQSPLLSHNHMPQGTSIQHEVDNLANWMSRRHQVFT